MSIQLRAARPEDAATLLRFIQELATYEKEPDAVEATVSSLRAQLEAENPPFYCILAEEAGAPVGFALYFFNYSTWRGRKGVYLEDLFVPPEHRRKGIGLKLLRSLAAIAKAQGAARMEWSVLDWNTPAIDFYKELGAKPMAGWSTFRITDQALADLADGGEVIES